MAKASNFLMFDSFDEALAWYLSSNPNPPFPEAGSVILQTEGGDIPDGLHPNEWGIIYENMLNSIEITSSADFEGEQEVDVDYSATSASALVSVWYNEDSNPAGIGDVGIRILDENGDEVFSNTGITEDTEVQLDFDENTGETRDIVYTVEFWYERGGDEHIFNTVILTVHQSAAPVQVEVGFLVDDAVVSYVTGFPVEGGEITFVARNVSEWHLSLYNVEIASGDTDGEYVVTIDENPNYYSKISMYSVIGTDLNGDSFSRVLQLIQDGKELPVIEVEAPGVEAIDAYFINTNYSALTFTFSGLDDDLRWQISDPNGNTVTGDTEDSIPFGITDAGTITGTTPYDYGNVIATVQQWNGSNWNEIVTKVCKVYIMPTNRHNLVFLANDPEGLSDIPFRGNNNLYIVGYNYNGGEVSSWSLTSDNPDFAGDWTVSDEVVFELGSYGHLDVSQNLSSYSAITVLAVADWGKGVTASVELTQEGYQDPELNVVPNDYVLWNDTYQYIIGGNRSFCNVEVDNLIEGDTYLWTGTTGNTGSGVYPNVTIFSNIGRYNGSDITERGEVNVSVERDGNEIYSGSVMILQSGSNALPCLFASEDPAAVNRDGYFNLPGEGVTSYTINVLTDNKYVPEYTTGLTVTSGVGMDVYYDGVSIQLNSSDNESGSDIDAVISLQMHSTVDPALDKVITLPLRQQSL